MKVATLNDLASIFLNQIIQQRLIKENLWPRECGTRLRVLKNPSMSARYDHDARIKIISRPANVARLGLAARSFATPQ